MIDLAYILRTGYPTGFLDRPWVLQAIHKHIRDKNKLLANKTITKIEESSDGVIAHCQDGSAYCGDLIVACDGIHSKVRSEMWRLADQFSPGLIPKSDKNAISAQFRCLFGTTDMHGHEGDLELGNLRVVHGKGSAVFTISGKVSHMESFWQF